MRGGGASGAACDRLWEVDAQRDGRLGAKDAASFERHVQGCAACSGRMAQAEKMRELGGAIGGEGPTELELRRLRGRVLRDVAAREGGSRSRSRVLLAAAAAGVIVAGAAGIWFASRGDGGKVAASAVSAGEVAAEAGGVAEGLAGEIIASTGTRWSQTREGGVERVKLESGTLAAHVRKLRLEESFLVTLPDGELEVRGTTFEVTAVGGVTTRVHVDEGSVELRVRGNGARVIGAGETWPEKVAAVATAGATAAATATATATATASATGDEGAGEYADALAKLNQGNLDAAAAAFRAFVVAHPRAPQAEDASFLEAVALARAGRADAAAVVAERHLASFPKSFHRKEAAILVARAASARGDCEKARNVLRPWIGGAADAEATAALGTCAAPR